MAASIAGVFWHPAAYPSWIATGGRTSAGPREVWRARYYEICSCPAND